MNNSLGQNPCLVTAYLSSPCSDGSMTFRFSAGLGLGLLIFFWQAMILLQSLRVLNIQVPRSMEQTLANAVQ
jgi:hypothetical protein